MAMAYDSRAALAAPPKRGHWAGLATTARAALGLGLFLLIWEAVPRLGLVNPMMLPGPSALPGLPR